MRKKNISQRELRHKRLRKKVTGDSTKPRLCIYRSLNNISAQMIDDIKGETIFSLSTYSKDTKAGIKNGGNVKAAVELGKMVAEKAKAKSISKVVFDRGGRLYHGRVKAFADSARKAGLVF